jgi:hypothetical protein
MMTSKCFSLWLVNFFFYLTVGTIAYGAVPTVTISPPINHPLTTTSPFHPFQIEINQLTESSPVWTSFIEEDPVLAVFRVEKIYLKACMPRAFEVGARSESSLDARRVWEPFTADERKQVEACDRFPCKVKLNEKEVAALQATPQESRFKRYGELVDARVQEAQTSRIRNGYERKEAALDGWEWLRKKRDFRLPYGSEKRELVGRRLGLAKKSGYAEVRQIFEQVKWSGPGRSHLWIQDLYTDHYFDSWSEEVDFLCTGADEGVLTQTVVIELDLLKNTDFLSRMMKGKIRHGVREETLRLLKDRRLAWFK